MKGAVGPQRTVAVSPFIGFSLTDNVKKGHLIVDGIFEKGPAYQVGVDVDHELVAIHDEKVSSIEHVRRLIGKYCFPGRVTRFTLRDAHGCLYNPMVWVMTADDRFSDKKYFFDVALHPKKESSRIKREWRPTE
ncbi:hypothetical protein ADEAN_000991900 [Angomonas deanei]|uniref:PDZ domain-containing protein n=1 Tax=Angomonas deanei TaxID=59799 RepID=A0A7G2CS63_9TRYP|nr:hypothetical protein ADEAN_000991900 [Angomonas deanei]